MLEIAACEVPGLVVTNQYQARQPGTTTAENWPRNTLSIMGI